MADGRITLTEEVMRMALSKYRAWIGRRDGDEDYVTFKSAAKLAAWLMKDWPKGHWGIEKYDNDSWVDAFYSDDIVDIIYEIKGATVTACSLVKENHETKTILQ